MRISVCLAFFLWIFALPVHAVEWPPLGQINARVLNCHYSDYEPPSQEDDSVFATRMGQGLQFWNRISEGKFQVNMTWSPWREMSLDYTTARRRMGNTRWISFDACLAAHGLDETPSGKDAYIVLTHPSTDTFGGANVFQTGTVLGGAAGINDEASNIDVRPSLVAHEFGHALWLRHANGRLANPEEGDASIAYADRWSVMGGGNQWDLSAFERERLHLIPHHRIRQMHKRGQTRDVIRLSDQKKPEVAGDWILRIPFSVEQETRYFLVEYTQKYTNAELTETDPARLYIYEVGQNRVLGRPDNAPDANTVHSVLLYDGASGGPLGSPAVVLRRHGVTIAPARVGPNRDYIVLNVTSRQADRCEKGFVWREASGSDDKVCVTKGFRRLQKNANIYAHGFGNDTLPCRFGLEPRRASPGDDLCVPSSVARLIAEQNAAQFNGTGNLMTQTRSGPNTCIPGFVHRLATPRDFVCTGPARQREVMQENAAAAARSNPGGQCRVGFVWREVDAMDRVCVPIKNRLAAQFENREARNRMFLRNISGIGRW
ncbi:MAG: hypothetical protein AAGD04_08880 [Pseudomonadota bacterium]